MRTSCEPDPCFPIQEETFPIVHSVIISAHKRMTFSLPCYPNCEKTKPFICTQCKYSCTRAGNPKRRMLPHSGENLFSCPQCDYFCIGVIYLKTHMPAQSGENISLVYLARTFAQELNTSRYTCEHTQERNHLFAHIATTPALKLVSLRGLCNSHARKNHSSCTLRA